MHLRKKRSQEGPLNEVETSHEESLAHEYAQNDLQLTGTVDRLTLNTAIAELSRGYRVAFLLHDVEGYEHNEIARMMNWSVGNSKSQLHKARRKLRDWFRLHHEKKGFGETDRREERSRPGRLRLGRGMNRLESAL